MNRHRYIKIIPYGVQPTHFFEVHENKVYVGEAFICFLKLFPYIRLFLACLSKKEVIYVDILSTADPCTASLSCTGPLICRFVFNK